MQEQVNVDVMTRINRIEVILEGVVNQQKQSLSVQDDHEKRLRNVEKFQIAYEAAAKALESVDTNKGVASLNKDFVNVVLKFLAVFTALIGLFYLIIQSLSK